MQRRGIPPSDLHHPFRRWKPRRFQAVASGQVAASLAEAPPFNFKSIEAGRRVLLNYCDEIKNLQYASFLCATINRCTKPPTFHPLHESDRPRHRWLNDPANEKPAIELMVQRLKVDAGSPSQTYKFMIPGQQEFPYEASSMDPASPK